MSTSIPGFVEWFAFFQGELILFAAVFFLIGALDEIAVDAAFIVLRLMGKASTLRIPDSPEFQNRPLKGMAAVMIPAWQEAQVIGSTLAHALKSWSHEDLRIYVGCYRNDLATLEAAMAGCRSDPRVRLVIHNKLGPSSKADCLNRLYAALKDDEQRSGEMARMVILHDAEDMVDPLALGAMDEAMSHAEFVQIPVLALPQASSRWVGGHYCDEFAEAHAKTMTVRHALSAGIPGAGVGCGIAREMLSCIEEEAQDADLAQGLSFDKVGGASLSKDAAQQQGQTGPFPVDSLTEDYELGLHVKQLGGRDRFLRMRTQSGRLVATRAYFPATLEGAIRQKARWVQGIALQGWDRLGWDGSLIQKWMKLRDRRGPFAALVLASGYALIMLSAMAWGASQIGLLDPIAYSPLLWTLLAANFAALGWRALMRFAFTAREFGFIEGLMSLPRMVVSNIVAILAGRRALFAYIRALRGSPFVWDKTAHSDHPAANDRETMKPVALPPLELTKDAVLPMPSGALPARAEKAYV